MRRSRGAWVLTPLLLLAACDGDPVSPVARDFHDTPLARTPAASAGVVEMVTGSGHYDAGILSTYSFHAIRYADGRVEGHYQVRRHPLGSSGARQHGRIICFTVEGNQAWLGAIRTRTAAETNEGTWTGFSVVDNGEGKGSPRDLIAPLVRNTGGQVPAEEYAMDYCRNQELHETQTLIPIKLGNIQIHH